MVLQLIRVTITEVLIFYSENSVENFLMIQIGSDNGSVDVSGKVDQFKLGEVTTAHSINM